MVMKASVLIVEDEHITALAIQRNLEKLGYSIQGVEDRGEAAIAVVKEKQPDLVLMDILLKGELDGIETAEEIHSFSNVPIIYMTAWSDDHTIHRAKLTEPFSYLVKPLRERELEIAIEIALFKHKMEEELRHSEEKFRTLVEGIPDIVYRIDEEGNFIYLSDNIRELGYEPEELIGQHFSMLIHPDDVKEVSRASVIPKYQGKQTGPEETPKLFDERRSGERSTTDLRIRIMGKGPAGQGETIIPTRINSFGIHRRKNPYGEVIHHETMGIMKTRRSSIPQKQNKKGPAALEEEPENLLPENLLEETGLSKHTSEDVIFKIDDKGLFTYVSEGIRCFGYDPEDLLGRHFSCIVHAEDLKTIRREEVLSSYAGKETGDENAPKLFDERRTGERATHGLELRIQAKTGQRADAEAAEQTVGEDLLWGEVSAAGSYDSSVVRRDKSFLGSIGVIRDVTERKRSEDEVKRIAREWQTTFDSLGDIILIQDKDYSILRVNRAFENTFHITESEVIGKKCYEIVHGLDHPPPHCVHNEKQVDGGTKSTEFFEPNINAYVETTIAPIQSTETGEDAEELESENHEGYVHVIKDITERKRNELEIQKAKQRAEEANKAKTRFLAQMSHDLRTPLNAVMGFTQLLKDAEEDLEKKKMLGHIQQSGTVLLGLMTDLIDLTRLEFGKITLRKEVFSITELVDNLATQFRLEAKKKDLAFVLDTESLAPGPLIGDPLRLEQIFMNLLNNAVKFTEEGTIELRVSSEESEEGEKRLISASIRDTGRGIPQSEMETIFYEYTQGKEGNSKGGTGLGLNIVRQLVHLMGGKIDVKSSEGQGSEFTISIPFDRADEKVPEAPKTSQEALSQEETLRVLVAEDDRINQLLITKVLEKTGWEPTVVENGEKAVASFQAAEWDLILMDINMPVMDGLEAIRQIRSIEKEKGSSRVPIISLTANALAEDRQICIDAGADDYITKPLNIEALKEMIASLRKT